MELQSEVLTGKTIRINEATRANKPPSYDQQPKVKKIRKILLILTGILLLLCFTNFLFIIHSFLTNNSVDNQYSSGGPQLVSILISIVYYAFGFLVTYRYYQTGLLVFVWLGFVSLLLILVIVIIDLIGIIVIISHLGFARNLTVGFIFIVLCITVSLFQIFTVRYAFLLYRLLKNTKILTIEQI